MKKKIIDTLKRELFRAKRVGESNDYETPSLILTAIFDFRLPNGIIDIEVRHKDNDWNDEPVTLSDLDFELFEDVVCKLDYENHINELR